MKEKLLPYPLIVFAYGTYVGIPVLIQQLTEAGLEIPIHRKYAEPWMEESPYFRVFDMLED